MQRFEDFSLVSPPTVRSPSARLNRFQRKLAESRAVEGAAAATDSW